MLNLKEVIISITNRCNSKCKMCDIPAEKTEELSTAQWKQVIKDASLIGAKTLVFSGGEPLLREDIFELIYFVKNNFMNACLVSNGYFINEEIADGLSRAGIGVVNISIEGPEQINDYLRGSGAFEKAVLALENLKKYNIESTIATMVSRYNYRYLSFIVELAKDFKVTTIKFQPFSRIFLINRNGEDYLLVSDEEIKELKQIIEEVVRLCSYSGIATNPRSYLEMMPFYLGNKCFDFDSKCNVLSVSCPINSKGEIYPCWVLTQKDKLIGNVNQDGLFNIWNSSRHISIIEKIRRQGCPGCMMSCYDENFGKDALETKIVINVKRLQNYGMYEYFKKILKKWEKRLKFYSTYRGSFRGVINKLRRFFIRRKILNKMDINIKEIERALEEITTVRQIFEEEIRCNR